jgi:K+-sensing histidine kinase KdpD
MWRLPHIYINVPAPQPRSVGGYAFALVSVGVAIALRLAVDPYVGVPFVTFWPAVIVTALIGGVGAGLFCVVISAAAATVFVITPHLSFYIENLENLLVFLMLASFSVIIITQSRHAIEKAAKERLQLGLKAARLGLCQLDTTRHVFTWDTRSQEI